MKTLPLLLLGISSCIACAEVKLTVGDINDRRTTGKFFRGLEIELKISGPELANCKAMKVSVKDAVDDAGKTLKKAENSFGADEFQSLKTSFGNFGKGSENEYELKLEFENPSRSAKALKEVNGTVELLLPSNDPQSIVSIALDKESGKPVANPAIAAAGAEITFQAPKGSDVSYMLKDPKAKIAAIEICTADGKAIETSGRMTSSAFGGPKSTTLSLATAPGAGAMAKIYLLTDKSRVSVPISLKEVALP